MNLNEIKFEFNEKLHFSTAHYQNGRLAILINSEYEPYTTLSVNIPEIPLDENEILIKTWSENEDIAMFLRDSKWFENTGKYVNTGFVNAEIWKIKNF